MKKCDHVVGILEDDFLTMNYIEEIYDYVKSELIKPDDLLDKNKHYIDIFNYCPLCGQRIDWKAIRKDVADSKR